MAFRTVVEESHWSHRRDLITGIPVQISCSTKASVMFPGLCKASHREEAFLVPHSSCLCLHRVKETQSRERSFRLCTCVCALDVVGEPFLTDLWTGCCDPFCLETPSLVLVLFIIFTWPEVYLPFHLHVFLSCALTFGSYFIRHFMLKHSVKSIESKEIKGGLKWTLRRTASFFWSLRRL